MTSSGEGGGGDFFRPVVVRGFVPLLLLGVEPLRDPEFMVSNRHDLGVAGFTGGLS
jgi:hypothetical protein